MSTRIAVIRYHRNALTLSLSSFTQIVRVSLLFARVVREIALEVRLNQDKADPATSPQHQHYKQLDKCTEEEQG